MSLKYYLIKVLIFAAVVFFNSVAHAQQSSSKENPCQLSIEEILSVIKSAYGFTPSSKEVSIAGEIQGGWGRIHLPEKYRSLFNVFAMLGGVLKNASGSVYLIRQSSEDITKSKLEIDLSDIKQGFEKDIKLEKGDLVFVPRGCVDGKLLPPTKPEFPRGLPPGNDYPIRIRDKRVVR